MDSKNQQCRGRTFLKENKQVEISYIKRGCYIYKHTNQVLTSPQNVFRLDAHFMVRNQCPLMRELKHSSSCTYQKLNVSHRNKSWIFITSSIIDEITSLVYISDFWFCMLIYIMWKIGCLGIAFPPLLNIQFYFL